MEPFSLNNYYLNISVFNLDKHILDDYYDDIYIYIYIYVDHKLLLQYLSGFIPNSEF